MQVKVDWISFSVPLPVIEDQTETGVFYATADAIHDLHPDLPELLHLDVGWEAGNGRAPYRTSWRHPNGGITIFTHPALPHALIEISGRGCEAIQVRGSMDRSLAIVRSRVTRIDLAADVLTDVRPLAFVQQRAVGRFKAHSEVVSESGETCYVGAKTSERYARVYRYNPPHERAHLLRCEYVVKGENAKLLIDALLSDGAMACAATLGGVFGWEHPCWVVDEATPAEIAVWRPERREGKTLFWLNDTIAPLLARLHTEGVINATEWLHNSVIPLILPGSDR